MNGKLVQLKLRLQISWCDGDGDENGKIFTIMGDGDGGFFVEMKMGTFLRRRDGEVGDGENLMEIGWGWGQFYLSCHSFSLYCTLNF